MAASPITVAVIHTPYWNISDVAFLREGPHTVLVPALLYLGATDIETTHPTPRPPQQAHEQKRKRPCTSHRSSPHQFVHRYSPSSEAEHSKSSPCSVDSSDSAGEYDKDPANILHDLNVTEHERLLLRGLQNDIRQDGYHGSTPSFEPESKRMRHDIDASRAMEQRSLEEEKDEYERWLMGSWDNLFSRASVYSEEDA
ncbi:hypothetical protein FVEG_17515 [Fusarium verticillioides 7600]|uniref:Uncharacterized protein n=1 Tax=Gibberella moniliformis (strain M3125 / FGSC 7600) TaxID=334819 RepID=W7N6U7_GIBM7|nr:hypothetical protein FVEG_17515 [Fusarium verticillioides 7600]EWG55384.1 hypothetical protein FVEG_17515 [Fusarium verticillioides 7600]